MQIRKERYKWESILYIRANRVQVTLMGKLEIKLYDYVLTSEEIHSKKLEIILAYLLYNYKRIATKNELADLLFEDGELINPIGAVKNLIYRLRRFLKEIWPDTSFLETNKDGYYLNSDLKIEIDTEKIDELIKEGISNENW